MRYLFRAISVFFRFLFVTATAAVVVLLITGIAAFLYRTTVTTIVVDQLLHFYGYADANFQIDEISANRIRVSDISLGPDVSTIESITVSYALEKLLLGRMDSLVIDGLDVRADFVSSQDEESAAIDIGRITAPLFQSGANVTISDSRLHFTGTPVGNLSISVAGEADFARTPASIDMKLNTLPLNDNASLTAFSFSGGGTVEPTGIDIRGPTKVSFANKRIDGWKIDRLDYDDIAHLRIEDQTARFTLSAPIDLGVHQVTSIDENSESDRALALDLRTGAVQVAAEWSDGLLGSAEIVDGYVEVGAWRLKGEDIHLEIPFERNEISGGSKLSALISELGETTRFHPQRLKAELHKDGETFSAEGTATPINTTSSVTFLGKYSLADGHGSIEIGPSQLLFSENGLQPRDISPLLSSLQNTTGSLRLNGNITLTPGTAPTSHAVVALENIKTDFSALSFVGLTGELQISDIFNPRSPPGQILKARQLTAPVPIKEPKIVLQWVKTGSDPVIRIETAEGQFADGTIGIESTSVHVGAPTFDLNLLFDELSLEKLFKEWAGGRVSGDGTLSGSIPVTLGPDGPIILDGGLVAKDTGFIKVHWGEARQSLINQGNEVALMVEALDNFQYKQLKVGVRRPSNQDLTFQVLLEGANPEVLDGHPFRINVNLSGNLEDVLTALIEGQAMTEDLLRAQVKNAN